MVLKTKSWCNGNPQPQEDLFIVLLLYTKQEKDEKKKDATLPLMYL